MKKIINTGIMALGLLHADAQESDMTQLKKLNAAFIHNFVTNDVAAHSLIIHKDFIRISSDGQCTGRKKYLEDWAHGFGDTKYWDYRNEDIKIFGNMALVHSQNKCIIIQDGKELISYWMYTDTYIKENGEWKCVQAQIGKVTPENFARDETIVRKYDFRKT
ncbi:MAG: nuclear transport factor 2 family protein [Chitinophagaceae bacterium]|nr:nuclear transport factor 2 family protein [Chitinophagaceae bacterium]